MPKTVKPIHVLFLFVLVNLIIGWFIVPDYGRSTDESPEFRTADLALRIYTSEINQDPEASYEDLAHNRNYGTASTALVLFIERFIFPDSDHATKVVAHYSYFIFFQAAVVGMFLLGNHFLDPWTSLGAALLFGTQPLLFGHAFINPKDIPLLTTFLFTVVAGFRMVDQWLRLDHPTAKIDLDECPDNPTRSSRSKKQLVFTLILVFLFLILWGKNWITSQLLNIVEYGYTTRESSLLGNLFAAFTTSGSLEGYFTLVRIYTLEAYRWIAFGTPVLLLLTYYYARRNQLYDGYIHLVVLLAAAIWGFAISTRVLAIAAGGVVGLYALVRLKQKAVLPLVFYTLTAGIVSYVTWPFLWVYGMKGYLEALKTFSDFSWTGQVLFEGRFYQPHNLPDRYLPKLMALQFTEPLVILATAGFMVSLYLLYRKKIDSSKLLLLYAWIFIPVLYAMLSDATVYSNFRHFLFTTPPLFIFAGLALQQITTRAKKTGWILLILALILVPGLVSIVQIHPYQYVYYNSFTGGISGAYQKYELDYWNLAYKDAMEYVNGHVPPGNKILVWKDNLLGEVYSREEFIFRAHTTVPEKEYENFDYAIMPIGKYDDIAILKNSPVAYTVRLKNAHLLVVLKINSSN